MPYQHGPWKETAAVLSLKTRYLPSRARAADTTRASEGMHRRPQGPEVVSTSHDDEAADELESLELP